MGLFTCVSREPKGALKMFYCWQPQEWELLGHVSSSPGFQWKHARVAPKISPNRRRRWRWEGNTECSCLAPSLPPLCPFSIYGAAGCNSHTTASQVHGIGDGLSARLRDTRVAQDIPGLDFQKLVLVDFWDLQIKLNPVKDSERNNGTWEDFVSCTHGRLACPDRGREEGGDQACSHVRLKFCK